MYEKETAREALKRLEEQVSYLKVERLVLGLIAFIFWMLYNWELVP